MIKTKTNIFKSNFRLIVFSVCFLGVATLFILQITLFTWENWAPNLLAEVTGMFLSNIFTLLIIDQYYRIQREKEFSKTLNELEKKFKILFHIYKKHLGKMLEIENNQNSTIFLQETLEKINKIQKNCNENNDFKNLIEHYDFIHSFEELGNVAHSIIHILNILPSEFEIKDFLVSFEKINTTILIIRRHLIHNEKPNYCVFLNDLKFITEQLLEITKLTPEFA